jgi:hypothetical protein
MIVLLSMLCDEYGSMVPRAHIVVRTLIHKVRGASSYTATMAAQFKQFPTE